MAARNMKKVQTLTPEMVILAGYVVGAGASTPTNPTGASKPGAGISSVTRTGAGLYTIKLEDKWTRILVVQLSIVDAGTVDDWQVEPLVINESAKTITVAVTKGDAVTATDITTSQRLQMMIVAQNSTLRL